MSILQEKAKARNCLFRQIHGINLNSFINQALQAKAITYEELELLQDIELKLNTLKSIQFKGSKAVGLNPRRRCKYCRNVAHWSATILGQEKLLCNKHKEEVERENKQNYLGEYFATNIHKINPNE